MSITVDTDVLVLAISFLEFGKAVDLRYIPNHNIAASLGPSKSSVLPVLHAWTGCDTVSMFKHKLKCRKTALKI